MKTKKAMTPAQAKIIRPFWKNYFPNYQAAYENYVFERVWEENRLGINHDLKSDEENPLMSGYGNNGGVALSSYLDSDRDSLMNSLNTIYRALATELQKGNPKTAADLTPDQFAIVEIESELLSGLHDYIEKHCVDSMSRDAVSSAMALGAALMRLAFKNPKSAIASEIKSLFPELAEIVKDGSFKGAALALKRRPRKERGAPARYTDKKMQQAFKRMHPLINNSGLSQLAAANKVIKRMGLIIGAPYLVQRYRDWLPSRVGNSAK